MARFSVIIPSYRGPQFLSDAVDSVAPRTVSDFECSGRQRPARAADPGLDASDGAVAPGGGL
jgi:hypothetical protein